MDSTLYTLFALIATGINLISQWLFFILTSGERAIYNALAIGTLSGLLTKYILDGKWIFYYTPNDKTDNLYRIILYYLFDFNGSQCNGGALGLLVGFFLKYILDKRYVFEVSA